MSLASPLFLFMPAETPETISKAFYVLGNNLYLFTPKRGTAKPCGARAGF
nr:MAG TPA: hypothetical protein [Bacteriophage sp.]